MTPAQQLLAEKMAPLSEGVWCTPHYLGGEKSTGHATQLNRMVAAGEVEAKVHEQISSRRMYRLTPKGRQVLANRQAAADLKKSDYANLRDLKIVADGPGGDL